jgi:hypothetical protein
VIAVASGDAQSGLVSAALAAPLVILVKDGAGNPLANASVAFAVSGGGGTLSATSAVTDATGQAQTVLTLGPAAGPNTVTATTPGAAASITFTETGKTLSWATDIYPLFSQAPLLCTACHDATGPLRMKLTGNAATDYTAIVQNATAPLLIDTTNPAASWILQKATNTVAHGGGQRITTASAQYATILTWIQEGAKP